MEKWREHIVWILFLMVPFGYLSFGIVHEGHHLAILLASLVVAGMLAGNPWVFSFCTYLATWQVFLLIYGLLHPQVNPQVIMAGLDIVIFFLVGAVLYAAVAKSKIKKEVFYNAICAAAILQGTEAILQSWGFDPVMRLLSLAVQTQQKIGVEAALVGTLGNNNFLAAFLAISLPFFFRKGWAWCVPVVLALIFFASTTSAFIPAILGTLWYFHKSVPKKWGIGAIAGAVLLIVWYSIFQHSAFHSNPRWADWREAINIMRGGESLWLVFFGMGPASGWFQPYPLHNEWLTCLYKFGIAGFAILAGYVATIYRGNRMLLASFGIAAINMFGNYSLHLAPSAFLIIIVAGLIEREKKERAGCR